MATKHTTRTRHALDSAVPELPKLLVTVGIDQRARVRNVTSDGVLRLAYAPADSSAGESTSLLPLYSPRNANIFTLPTAAGDAIFLDILLFLKSSQLQGFGHDYLQRNKRRR